MKKLIFTLVLLLSLSLSLAACQNAPETTAPSIDGSCTHIDADDNGSCDSCQVSVLVELDFYAINDLHGRFTDTEDQPGVDELSTYLTSQPENTILLSSGDMWQGSFESSLTHGALMTEWMNEVGFAAMALGNHEFDWGESYVASNAQLADFPFLAINLYDRETGQQAEYCQSSVLVERSGIQIGIIGAIGDVHSSISGEHSQGILIKTGSELTELVKAEATKLRQQGADIIVFSHHDGGTDYALSDGYVDLVFEGHTHNSYQKKDKYGVYHVQGGAENSGVAHVEMSYNTVNQKIAHTTAEIIPNQVYQKGEDHPVVEELMGKYEDQIAVGHRVVGTSSKRLTSGEIGKLVAQLYYEAGLERWGSDYDIVLGGGLIATRNPYDLAAGEVRYSDLYTLLPFDNQLALCSIQGRDLLAKFFETTNRKYAIYFEDYGREVYANIDPNKTYYIIVDTYTSTYPPNKITEIERYDANVYARDLLSDYIAEGHLNDLPADGNFPLTDIPTIYTLGNALSPGETTQESYFVKGTVVSVENTKYGNLTIRDENGNTLFIYGVYDSTGSHRYDAMDNPPQEGDEVILYGRLQHYVSPSGETIIELVYARKVN